MKFVKAKGFGKHNKIVEDVMNEMIEEALLGSANQKYNPKYPRKLQGYWHHNPDEKAFAE